MRSIAIAYGPERARFKRVDQNETGPTTTYYVAGPPFCRPAHSAARLHAITKVGNFILKTYPKYIELFLLLLFSLWKMLPVQAVNDNRETATLVHELVVEARNSREDFLQLSKLQQIKNLLKNDAEKSAVEEIDIDSLADFLKNDNDLIRMEAAASLGFLSAARD